MTEHHAQADAPIGEKHRLDPFGADIAPKGRDDQIVLAAEDREIAGLVEAAQVARAPSSAEVWSTEIALHHRGPLDHDLAFVDKDLKARQRVAYRAFLERSRPIERDDGAAFGEAVSLIDWNPDGPGRLDQRGGRGRAPDRDETQAFRRAAARAQELLNPKAEELRREHRAGGPRVFKQRNEVEPSCAVEN